MSNQIADQYEVQLKETLTLWSAWSGNEKRQKLRKLVADLHYADRIFDLGDVCRIETRHKLSKGGTFRNFIDTVDRVVLWSMVSCAFGLRDKTATASLIITGMDDPSTCRNKERGSGTSYASHIGLPAEDHSMNLLRDWSNKLNYPPKGNTNMATNLTSYTLPTDSMDLANYILAMADSVSEIVDEELSLTLIQDELLKKGLQFLTDEADNDIPEQTKTGALSACVLIVNACSDLDQWHERVATAKKNLSPHIWGNILHKWNSPNEEDEAEAEPDNSDLTITVDANLANIINASLGAATNGLVNDINAVLKSVTDLTVENAKLKARPAVSSVPQVTKGVIGDLEYEIEMVTCAKVFGKKTNALKFDVPSVVWRDSSGNVVAHPQTPDVDPDYEFRTEHLVKFLTAHSFAQNIWLHGHTGTGKTTLAEQIAARLGYPVFRLNLDSSIERADIIGATQLREENGVMVSKFVEGILPTAMVLPAFFILDEMDAGHADVLFAVQRALEAKGLVLTEDGGRVIHANPNFRFVATANTRGQGDEHGWYAGVRPMNVATLDRFATFIEVGYLDPKTERKLLSNKFPALSDTDLTEFTELSKKIRDAFKSGELSTTISPRGMTAFCQTYLHFNSMLATRKDAIDHALEMVIVDRAPIDSQTKVKEFAQLCIN